MQIHKKKKLKIKNNEKNRKRLVCYWYLGGGERDEWWSGQGRGLYIGLVGN